MPFPLSQWETSFPTSLVGMLVLLVGYVPFPLLGLWGKLCCLRQNPLCGKGPFPLGQWECWCFLQDITLWFYHIYHKLQKLSYLYFIAMNISELRCFSQKIGYVHRISINICNLTIKKSFHIFNFSVLNISILLHVYLFRYTMNICKVGVVYL